MDSVFISLPFVFPLYFPVSHPLFPMGNGISYFFFTFQTQTAIVLSPFLLWFPLLENLFGISIALAESAGFIYVILQSACSNSTTIVSFPDVIEITAVFPFLSFFSIEAWQGKYALEIEICQTISVIGGLAILYDNHTPQKYKRSLLRNYWLVVPSIRMS